MSPDATVSKVFSIWFYSLALLYSVVSIPAFAMVMLVCRPFVSKRQSLLILRYLIKIWARAIVRVLPFPFIRVHYRDLSGGAEKQPFVYVGNHRSTSDAFLMCVLPGEGVQVVNIWPFRIPVIGFFARAAGYISIREMSFEDFKARIGENLAQGVSIPAFPEGTRSASRRLGQFHGALFRACLAFEPTIAPLCIMGNEDKPRKGSLVLRPGVIRVHRLPGITPDIYRGMSSYALKNHVRDTIEQYIRENEGTADEAAKRYGCGLSNAL